MRMLLPTILLIAACVFVCGGAAAESGIPESGTSTVAEPEQPGHTKTWIALGVLVLVLAAGALIQRKLSRKDAAEGAAQP